MKKAGTIFLHGTGKSRNTASEIDSEKIEDTVESGEYRVSQELPPLPIIFEKLDQINRPSIIIFPGTEFFFHPTFDRYYVHNDGSSYYHHFRSVYDCESVSSCRRR